MKKLILILMLLPLTVTGHVDSVETIEVENVVYSPYPQYSFWSNWEAGVRVGVMTPLVTSNSGLSYMYGISAYKELNNLWSLSFNTGVNHLKTNTGIYGNLSTSVQLSLVGLIEGYNPNRKLKIYVNGGVGLGVDRSGSMVQRFGKVYYEALCGLGVSYKMNKVTFRVEDNIHLPGDFGNGFKFDKGYYNCLSVGVYYNFGITKVDKARLTQMEDILTKGDAYDDAMYDCASMINKYQDSLQRTSIDLVKAVVECDSLYTRVEMLEKNTEEFEKLREQIDQMREEQYTYWALPVSIQFDFDSYNINDSEQYKVKALAEVMSGCDYKYLVVGFADSIGTKVYNEELSLKRANAVKNELIRRGVHEDQIEVRAVGMDSPFGTLHKTNRKVSVYRVIE